MSREFTTKLLEMVEDGALDKDLVIQAFCDYLSEDDIKEFMISNDFAEDEPKYINEDYDDDQSYDEPYDDSTYED
jgi:hypothetical protein